MQTEEARGAEENLYLRKKSWWKRPFPWIAMLVVAAGGITYAALRGHGASGNTTGYQVRWVPVSKGNVSESTSFSGTLEPTNQATVTASGTLTSVSVKVGDKVKKGQVIAHLDTASLENQLTQADAQLSSANAKLAQAKEPVTTTVAVNASSSSSGHSGSQGSSSSGQTQTKTETKAPDPNVVAQAQAAVNQAQAQVTSIEDQIAACTVKSPITGTVVQAANVNQTSSSSSSGSGNSGGSNNTIAIITDLSTSHFEVQANVAQSDITQIHAGQAARISLSSSGGSVVTGKVESVGFLPQSSGGVTQYPVVVKVNKPAQSGVTLLPGASVSVDVTEKQATNVLTVPTAALTQRRGQVGVYVKASSSSNASAQSSNNSSGQQGSFAGAANLPSDLEFHPVTAGLYGGNTVQIKSGLTEGEQVAIVLRTSSSSSGSTSSSNNNRSGFGALTGGFGGARAFAGSGRDFSGGSRSSSGGGSSRSGGGN